MCQHHMVLTPQGRTQSGTTGRRKKQTKHWTGLEIAAGQVRKGAVQVQDRSDRSMRGCAGLEAAAGQVQKEAGQMQDR
jgi:hypothetical protein